MEELHQEHNHLDHHEHSHNHHHDHEHGEEVSKEETLALLAYMVSHNKHHAEELTNLSAGVQGEAAIALQKAIALFQEGNQALETALKLME